MCVFGTCTKMLYQNSRESIPQNRILQSVKQQRKNVRFLFSPLKTHKVSSQVSSHFPTQPTKKCRKWWVYHGPMRIICIYINIYYVKYTYYRYILYYIHYIYIYITFIYVLNIYYIIYILYIYNIYIYNIYIYYINIHEKNNLHIHRKRLTFGSTNQKNMLIKLDSSSPLQFLGSTNSKKK